MVWNKVSSISNIVKPPPFSFASVKNNLNENIELIGSIKHSDIKNLYKIDDYTTKEDLEIRTINLLENFKDNDAIFKLIDTFKKKAMEVVK